MKTIGSHPGAILFRLSILVTVIAIIIIVFLSYAAKVRENYERASITQARALINSSLAVVFATYATKGRLDDLNELEGGNPFDFLEAYHMLPTAYKGEIEFSLGDDLEPGWYYLKSRRQVAYKPRYIDGNTYFTVVLSYDDLNDSGRFESKSDKFRSLQFVEVSTPRS